MLPATASVAGAERPAGDSLADYAHHLGLTGRGNTSYTQAAKSFMCRWPIPQSWAAEPLATKLGAGPQTRSFLMFLMVHGWLSPGYDYLVARKLSSIWRDIAGSPLESDMARLRQGAEAVGFTPIQAFRVASQSVARLLIQSGRPLEELSLADFEELTDAGRRREASTGKGWRHYRSALNAAHRVLFHLAVLDTPPPHWQMPEPFERRVADVHPALRPAFVAYLERKAGTCNPKTVGSMATRLAHFGRFLAEVDPGLPSLVGLHRERHIEPYLNSVASAINTKTGGTITSADQARRVLAVSSFLTDIAEWGWGDAPARRLVFRSDMSRIPRPLPRYLPVDADRRLGEALARSEFRLAADVLLLARATGLRIGELLDLELDCVHEVPGNESWLKVPLGKLDTERMVPLDDESLALIDRIVVTRFQGRPLPHPRTGRPAQFLFTHHGRRLAQQALRAELVRAADAVGIAHVTPHQLRHTFATAMVNAGVSLQALMALLGHVSAEMSLRYGRLFDATVRAEYERALDLAKTRLGPLPTRPARIPVTGCAGDWRDAPAIKARLACDYCLRAPAQGSCPYANICEYCPNLRTDATSIAVLATQRVDADALAADAQARGWIRRSGPPPPPRRPTRRPYRPGRSGPAPSCYTTANHSRTPPSPARPASAAPASTATRTCEPLLTTTAAAVATPAPSPDSPPRSSTCAPPSKSSPSASAATKNSSGASTKLAIPPAKPTERRGDLKSVRAPISRLKLRQRSGRILQRSLQDRADPQRRSLAWSGRRGARHPGVPRLVQPAPAPQRAGHGSPC